MQHTLIQILSTHSSGSCLRAQSGAGALLVGAGPFINSRRSQLIGLAALNVIPASYFERGFVDAGGLISYGDQVRQMPTAVPAFMSLAFSRVRSRATFQLSCHQLRTGHQLKDCQGARSYCAASADSPCRRGDPMRLPMSAY